MAALSRQNARLTGVDNPNIAGNGFTLLELLVALSILAILVAVTTPLFASYYSECCLKAVIWEIAGMVKEAKQSALSEKYYAICFDPNKGRVSLVSGRGPDGEWNTPDDEVVRTLRLRNKGGGLDFGYGSYGPVPTYAAEPDGVTFQDNALVCNPDLTGNAGTVYFRSRHGGAMALTMNSTDFGYIVRRWSGSRWEKL
jgi:prepilin-type N-terminal cleavage/methylation domain-containing protein